MRGAGAVGRDARHEHVALQVRAAAARRRLDLFGGRPLFPVVGDVEHGVERGQRAPQRGGVTAIRRDVVDARTEIVMVAPVEDRDLVPARRQPPDDLAADEQRSADDHDAHDGAS